ncbi:MAG: hypothetical protein JJT75_07945 [Opitutales bacterium]|nr:hypothetical protein [Opitutales bacterium]
MPSLSRSLFYTASLGMALITMSSADQPKPTWQAGEPDITFSREDLPEGSFRIDSEGHWIIAPTGLTEQGRNRMALRQTVDLELSEGDWVVLRARARALDTAEGSEGQAGLILNLHGPLNESDEAPHPFFRHIILVGPEWEDFEIPVEIPKDLTADDWFLCLVLV